MSFMTLLGDLSSVLHLVSRHDPDYDPTLTDSTKAPMILGVTGFLSGIAFLVVLVRFYVRAYLRRSLSIDDFFMLLALACACLIIVYLILESKHGLGRYTQFVTLPDRAVLVKLAYFHFLILGWGSFAVKFSFGLLLLRNIRRGKAYNFVRCILAFLVVLVFAHTGIQIFRCIPVSAGWSLTARETAQCMTRRQFMVLIMLVCGSDAMIDGAFATLCVFLFYNLQNTRRYRLAFISMATFGYLTCFCAIVKTAMTVYALKVKVKYRGDDYGIWSLLELHMAMIAASLPTLGPLFKSLLLPSRTGPTSQTTASIYTARRPERLGLLPLSSTQHKSSKGPRRPSTLHTVHTEYNDFEKNPGNRSTIYNYTVEVSAAKSVKKTRTGSFGAYRNAKGGNKSHDCDTEDAITSPRPVLLASNSSTRDHDGTCPTLSMSGIIRTTDVYVRMEEALEEENGELDGGETERTRSRWKC